MDWLQILQIALPAILVPLAASYFSKDNNRTIEKNNQGKYLLRVNRSYQFLGLLLMVIALVFIYAWIVVEEENFYLFAIPLILFFGGLGYYFYATYLNHEVVFNEHIIIVTNWKGEKESIVWKQIEKISYSKTRGILILHYKGGQLKIVEHIVGLATFARMLEHSTRWHVHDLGLHI